MRAVNLIPSESRRGGTAISQSGAGAYLVLGGLAALVLMLSVYAYEGSKIKSKRAEAAQTSQKAAATQAAAAKLGNYTSFSALKEARIKTVTSIANSRFNWSQAMHDLARVIPPNTWLTSLTGTVSPSVAVNAPGGGGGGGSDLRSAVNAPAIQISGCTTSQPAVAKMMARMRLIDGVDRVTLTSSEKGDEAAVGGGAASDSAADSGDCRAGSDQYPKFDLIVFFEPLETATAAATTDPNAAAQATPTTTPAGASQ